MTDELAAAVLAAKQDQAGTLALNALERHVLREALAAYARHHRGRAKRSKDGRGGMLAAEAERVLGKVNAAWSATLTIRYCSDPDGHAPKDCPDWRLTGWDMLREADGEPDR